MTTVTPESERQERQEREEREEQAQLVRLARQHLLERDLNLARQDWHDHWQERNKHARHPLVGDLESRRVRICWVETREWLSVVGVAFDEGLPA